MKKILIVMFLAVLSYGIYFGYMNFIKPKFLKDYTVNSELRDKALSNLTINTHIDTYTSSTNITAKWTSQINTNTDKSSVTMEVIATETQTARGKRIIASSSIKGITAIGSDLGSITCIVKPVDIKPDRPYGWIRISSVIDGKAQPPIIKYLGKFNP